MELTLVLIAATAALQPATGTQAAQAFAKQYSIDEKLDRFYRHQLSAEQRNTLSNAAIVAKVAIEHTFTLRWEF